MKNIDSLSFLKNRNLFHSFFNSEEIPKITKKQRIFENTENKIISDDEEEKQIEKNLLTDVNSFFLKSNKIIYLKEEDNNFKKPMKINKKLSNKKIVKKIEFKVSTDTSENFFDCLTNFQKKELNDIGEKDILNSKHNNLELNKSSSFLKKLKNKILEENSKIKKLEKLDKLDKSLKKKFSNIIKSQILERKRKIFKNIRNKNSKIDESNKLKQIIYSENIKKEILPEKIKISKIIKEDNQKIKKLDKLKLKKALKIEISNKKEKKLLIKEKNTFCKKNFKKIKLNKLKNFWQYKIPFNHFIFKIIKRKENKKIEEFIDLSKKQFK